MFRYLSAFAFCGLLLLGFPDRGAAGSDDERRSVIQRLFDRPGSEEAWFAPAFLAQVPHAEVERILEPIKERYGSFRNVTGAGADYRVQLEHAEIPIRITLDDRGLIAGLLIHPPIPTQAGLDALVGLIAGLPGKTSVLVLTDGQVRAAHEADTALAVGSAAKLAVLGAVGQAIADGRLAWETVVSLSPRWRSLPSSLLSDWPAGTPVTVATLAALMMAVSDNTAADALVDLVGRGAVEALAPRNRPFLTTREALLLKDPEKDGLRRRYAVAGETERRGLLDQLADEEMPLPTSKATLEIEWFLTARELCALLEAVEHLPSASINPGLANPADWRRVLFKGGSEFGVLNLSTRLVGADGRDHCVVATWNDTAGLAEERLVQAYRGILYALRTAR